MTIILTDNFFFILQFYMANYVQSNVKLRSFMRINALLFYLLCLIKSIFTCHCELLFYIHSETLAIGEERCMFPEEVVAVGPCGIPIFLTCGENGFRSFSENTHTHR